MGGFGFGRTDHTDGARPNRCPQRGCGLQVVGPRAAEREQCGLWCSNARSTWYVNFRLVRRRINSIQAPYPELNVGLLGSGPAHTFRS